MINFRFGNRYVVLTMKKRKHFVERLTILLFCLILIGVLHFLTFTLISKELIEEKMSTERILFDVYVASKANEKKISTIFDDNHIEGMAIFDWNGKMLYHYGNTPTYENLPKSNNAQMIGTSYIIMNKDNIEYIGYPQTSQQISEENNQSLDFSKFIRNIIVQRGQNVHQDTLPLQTVYVKRKDISFIHRIFTLRIVQVFSTVIIAMLGLVLNQYEKKNIELLDKINKKETKATMGEAARTLAHEIKNPLSTITIQLAILKKINPENMEDYELIEKEIQRILTLADRTTNFLSNPIGTPKNIPIVPFIKEFYTRFSYPLLIANEPGTENIKVYFDEVRLRSVIENLIKNAVEATEEKNEQQEKIDELEPVSIEISECGKNQVRILVQDRGVGLPKNVKTEELFDAFYTTKVKGSGIGLSICSQFVETQGGTIQLYDRQGGGTVAEVVLKKVIE